MSIKVTKEDLYNQASSSLNLASNLSALETQSDVINYTLQSLIQDIKASGVTLSDKTNQALVVLQKFSSHGGVSETDVTNACNSIPTKAIDDALSLKSLIRQLQYQYYTLKTKLGL